MLHNYNNAMNGRIWILWDDNVYKIDQLTQGSQYIHCHVTSRDKKVECYMTVVYGFNTMDLRKSLWAELRIIAGSIDKPWLIWGDFNALLHCQDRLHEHPITRAKIIDFENCMQDLFLIEVTWKGEQY